MMQRLLFDRNNLDLWSWRAFSRASRLLGSIAVLLTLLIFLHPLIHTEPEDHPGCPLCAGVVATHPSVPYCALIGFTCLIFSIFVSNEDTFAIYTPAGFRCKRAPPQSLLYS